MMALPSKKISSNKVRPNIFWILVILSCNTTTTSQQPIKDTQKKSPSKVLRPSEIQEKDTFPTIVYDTIFYPSNNISPSILEKYKEGKDRLAYYTRLIDASRRNQPRRFKNKYGRSDIKYLGTLKILGTQLRYHVITDFSVITAMLSPRGHSEIAFVDESKTKIIIYNVEMPNNLPTQIEKDLLYFKFEKGQGALAISGGLPPMLCIPRSNGCY